MPKERTSLNDLLDHRAYESPADVAYRFVKNPDEPGAVHELTYRDLWVRVTQFSALLRERAANDARVVLLYPPGLDYIVAFYSCLWAGMIPVPAYPIHNNHHAHRLMALAMDCGASLILAPPGERDRIRKFCAEIGYGEEHITLLSELPSDGHTQSGSQNAGSGIAFLQYTSGSTGAPKGVMVGHDNALHNLKAICHHSKYERDTIMFSWLPPYHDLGLLTSILAPLYAGFPVTLMSPFDFLQSPQRWPKWISALRATVSGGPNFAFDLCVAGTPDEAIASLDLSSVTQLFSGAEPIQDVTLRRFYEKFRPCGFRKTALYPSYGLAEGTLFVSGGVLEEEPVVLAPERFIDLNLNSGEKAPPQKLVEAPKSLVGCGRSIVGQSIAIVNPNSGCKLPSGQEGEIWVKGPSVAKGYFGKAELSKSTFEAYAEDGAGPYLRTGDLGIQIDGELFVTGRIKDLIFIRGRKHHPHDVERAVEGGVDAVRPACSVAFGYGNESDGEWAFVCEIKRTSRKMVPADLVNTIRQEIGRFWQLMPSAIIIVQPGRTFKTSSGKVQRALTKEAFLRGSLDIWGQWKK